MLLSEILGAEPAPEPVTIDLPEPTLALPLFDFQQYAVNYIRTNRTVYIAYEMGLGKTPIGIATASMCHAVGIRTLVVVPASLRKNWEREFHKFAPHLSPAILMGTKPHAIPPCDVLIIGESTVKHWVSALQGQFNALVVDEAHFYKNNDSKRSKALRELSHSVTGPVVLMSGTPTPNGRHQELASQINVLGDDAWAELGGRKRFWNYFCPPDPQSSWGGRVNANSEELHKTMTTSFMLRRKRSEVIELPNKGRSAVSIECSRKHANDYVRIQNDLISWLREEGLNYVGAMRAEALVRMNQLRKTAGAGKVDGVAEYVKEILANSNTGVFVVAEHKEVMDRLMLKLDKYQPVSVRGGMTDTAKQNAVDAFNTGASRVLVGQIRSAGVGLTLHGNGLNHRVIVAQLPWTPAELVQAEDRLHRIGQTNDVEVEIALAHIDGEWTIDERLFSVLTEKYFNASTVLDGTGEVLLPEAIAEGVLDTFR